MAKKKVHISRDDSGNRRSPEVPESMKAVVENRYDRLRILARKGDVSGSHKKDPFTDVSIRIPQVPSTRRAQEINDSRILFADHEAFANLPREAIHTEFNKYHPERIFGED